VGCESIHELLSECETSPRMHHRQALVGQSPRLTLGQDTLDRFALPPECQRIVMAQPFHCPEIRKLPQRISPLDSSSQIEVLTTWRNGQRLAHILYQPENFKVIFEFLPAQSDALDRRKDPAGLFQL